MSDYNTDYIVPAAEYQNSLLRQIDNNIWEGEDVYALELELEDVNSYVERGEKWYPLF